MEIELRASDIFKLFKRSCFSSSRLRTVSRREDISFFQQLQDAMSQGNGKSEPKRKLTVNRYLNYALISRSFGECPQRNSVAEVTHYCTQKSHQYKCHQCTAARGGVALPARPCSCRNCPPKKGQFQSKCRGAKNNPKNWFFWLSHQSLLKKLTGGEREASKKGTTVV